MFWQNPFPILDGLRENGRAAVASDGTKLVLRHADVAELLLSGRFENEGVSLLERRGFRPGDALYEYRAQALGALSGDAHRRVRALVGKAMTLHRVEHVRAIVERRMPVLLEPLLGVESDLLDTLMRLPVQVIGEYLGIADGDRERVDGLIREGQAKAFGREVTPETVQRTNRIFEGLMQFVAGLIVERRIAPHNDVLARLLEVEEDGGGLSQQEVIVLFLNLLIGATESTISSMSTGVLLLAEQPVLLDQLQAQPALVAVFVEENLRLYPPNTLLANKIAVAEQEFCGHVFARGERVMVPIPAPNRDPRVFADPERLDLRRRPERHFSFSLGAHFCLGHALARLQLGAFFSTLAARVQHIDLLDSRPEWEPFAAVTSLKSLRVRLIPRGSAVTRLS